MQKVILCIKRAFEPDSRRSVAVAAFLFVAALLSFWIFSRVRAVEISRDGKTQTVYTALCSPADIIELLGVDTQAGDKVVLHGFDNGGFFGSFEDSVREIVIRSAVDVTIEADKLKYHVTASSGDTVADAVYDSGLEVRSSDYLNLSSASPVAEGSIIKITRVDYVITTEEETVQRESEYRSTSLFTSGKTVLVSYGKNGTMLNTYEQKTVDGVVEDTVLVSQDIIKKPTNDIYLVGDGSAISPLDYGYNIVNGVPESYSEVFSNVRATGYYASYGSGTASGRLAQVGYVAVDPSVIPYGTKLWIVAHGNSGFVYGYALAADTGGAMLSGKNFVDLYYETYYECVLNGLRYVDVYVLG